MSREWSWANGHIHLFLLNIHAWGVRVARKDRRWKDIVAVQVRPSQRIGDLAEVTAGPSSRTMAGRVRRLAAAGVVPKLAISQIRGAMGATRFWGRRCRFCQGVLQGAGSREFGRSRLKHRVLMAPNREPQSPSQPPFPGCRTCSFRTVTKLSMSSGAGRESGGIRPRQQT